MDFALDETQLAVAALTREVLAKEPDPDSAWQALGQAGLLSGDGLGVAESAVVLAEIGRAAAPLPALSTLGLGVLPVARLGTAAQRAELLPAVAAGERVLTSALRCSVTVAGNTLTGKAVGVPDADRAHRMLVPAGASVFLVDPAEDGVTLTPTRSAAGGRECTVMLDAVHAERLGDSEKDTEKDTEDTENDTDTAAELHRIAVACACVYGDGLLAGALDLTAAHLRTREQFGKPLATFQAVAQQIADVYVAARTLHLAAWSACWRLAEGLDPDGDLAVAAYWLAEEAMPALHTCHHLHGGLGVDADYPLHAYYSTTKDLVRLLGGVEHRLALLGLRTAG